MAKQKSRLNALSNDGANSQSLLNLMEYFRKNKVPIGAKGVNDIIALARHMNHKVKMEEPPRDYSKLFRGMNSEIEPQKHFQKRISHTSKKFGEDPKHVEDCILATKVECLNLSPKITTALLKADVNTIGDIISKKRISLVRTLGVGGRGVREIEEALRTQELIGTTEEQN